jgi:hypothetical protein
MRCPCCSPERALEIARLPPRAHNHWARAILECHIDTIPDERADEGFVLWTVRDKLNEAFELC